MSTINSSNVSNKFFSMFNHLKYEYLVAGVAGGIVSTLVLHPLDLIKIRFAGKVFYKTFYYINII
jgi:solute carrier family 25 folate transporter 32